VRGKQGQSTLEYVILLGFVAAAIIAAAIYISRGFQGRMREQADEMGDQYSFQGMDTNLVETTNVSVHSQSGKHDSSSSANMIMITEGHENVVNALNQEVWH